MIIGLTVALAGGAFTAATALAEDPDHLRERARQLMEEAEHLMRVADREEHGQRDECPEAEEVERRIHHLHEAAGHLDIAGYGEWADEVRRVAEEMERELHERDDRGRHDDEGHHDELVAHVKELTHAFKRMHRHVEELTEVVHDLQERVDHLSRER
jgi:uncharacterized protein YlxW (UPF0749 family)